MFNWDDLRYFIEITRTESLSGAASKLGISHTTVARRIHALEECLAVRLFDKAPNGYRLTEAGTQLLKLAEQVESTCIAAQELVAGQDPLLTGTVRLSVPEGFGTHFIIKHLENFWKRYPMIDLDIVALAQSLSISKREADIAVTLSQPNAGHLIVRHLSNFTLRIVATPGYLERSPAIKDLQDVRSHRFVSSIFSTPEMRFLDEILPDASVRVRFKNINAQLAAVEAGLGMSLLPSFMTTPRKNLVAILPEQATVTRSFWISRHEDMRHVSRISAVWNWLKEITAAEQALLLGIG